MPAHWRPLHVEGDWDRGNLIVGDATQAVFQVKWRRTPPAFRADRWLDRRLRKVGIQQAERGPAHGGFELAAWSPRGGRLIPEGALWYGHAPRAALVIEIAIAAAASKNNRRQMEEQVIRRMQATAQGAPVRWAIFGSSFVSPPGFVLARRRLHLGDVALEWTSPDRTRLTVRQVYPGSLALARREMPEWMEFTPFREYRRFKAMLPTEPWAVQTPEGTWAGLRRRGRKAVPFPFGWLAPRHSVSAVVHHTGLDRLLIAECDARNAAQPVELTAEALRAMDWAGGPGGEA